MTKPVRLQPWRGLVVCRVETRLDAKTRLDKSVEAAGRSAGATKPPSREVSA
jgi:hypothetical protein